MNNDKARLTREKSQPLRDGDAPHPDRMSAADPAFNRPAGIVSAKVGLLDTPMRLAFQKTGAHAVWRGAFRLLEKTAGAALNNKVGEVIKAGLIDRYGLADAVVERNDAMRIKMIADVRQVETFLTRLPCLAGTSMSCCTRSQTTPI